MLGAPANYVNLPASLASLGAAVVGRNLLAEDLGDAGGLKWYHGSGGVLLDNDLGGGSYAYRKDAYYWNGAAWIYGGFLTEESGEGEIRNNTMQGAGVGTAPDNWTIPANPEGLTADIQGVVIEDGVECLKLRYHGTSTSVTPFKVDFETTTQIVAANGETHTHAPYLKLEAGSLAGLTMFATGLSARDGDGFLVGADTVVSTPPTDTLLRYEATKTMDQAATAFVQPFIEIMGDGVSAIDFTVLIGLPDNKEKPVADSVIKTFGVAATRKADLGQVIGKELVGTEGSLVAQVRLYEGAAGSFQTIFIAIAANNLDRLVLGVSGAGIVSLFHRQNGVEVSELFPSVVLSDNTVHGIAASWDGSSILLSVDGGAATSAAVAGVFAQALLENYYGHEGNGASPLNGFIPRLVAYDYKMDSAELAQRSKV